ncbi:zinc finger protein 668-like [Homalodisca vitripennis]|uniref:zinc finger protein 668-like n=1 Tax=Homalodisca vitripennis TaxID=197043 RepID=UPI001EEA9B49|nr:zinc finger protein 668-like [Homalodisca vitripennis]
MTISTMFPIIPHHLSGRPSCPVPAGVPSSRCRQPETRRKLHVTVSAAVDIPALACTPAIPLDSIVQDRVCQSKYKLELDTSGLVNVREGNAGWVKHTRVSPDCHSFNTIVHRVRGQSAVTLQTVREIKRGEEFCLWFDEDVLASADIPFLSPSNIQGEKNYICHRCRKHFEYPNPLKVHLSLDCGTLRRVELWKRLSKAGESEPACTNEDSSLQSVYDLKLSKPLITFKDRPSSLNAPSSPDNCVVSASSNSTTFGTPRSDEELERPPSEPTIGRYSAFKPYLNIQTAKSEDLDYKPSNPLLTVPSNLIFSSPTQGSLIDQHAVEMETLVSNLGRSKQGHLCIYCGKVYSRKYGLKIHIRTHTGFKPLKCKFCLRPFGDPSNLNKHVRLHAEGETPYKCEECGKVLVRRRDLERHIKSRHQQEECI